jgi:hypothetical protein
VDASPSIARTAIEDAFKVILHGVNVGPLIAKISAVRPGAIFSIYLTIGLPEGEI